MTFRHWVCLLVLAAAGVSPAAAQFEYTPDHPEVEEMVRRGIAYLRSKPTSELGPRMLNALAICEYTKRYEEYIPFDDRDRPVGSRRRRRLYARPTGEDDAERDDVRTVLVRHPPGSGRQAEIPPQSRSAFGDDLRPAAVGRELGVRHRRRPRLRRYVADSVLLPGDVGFG